MHARFEILEIPVYWTSQKKYLQNLEVARDKYLKEAEIEFNSFRGLGPLEEDQKMEFIKQQNISFNRSEKALSWKYNQIIGYICLSISPNQIRGEYYQIEGKRLRRNRVRNIYKYVDKVIEIGIFSKDTNEEISNKIMQSFEHLNKTSRFKKRYVYIDNIEKLVTYIDWKKLIPTTF